MTPLATYTNVADGIEAVVILSTTGRYHVCLRDTDAGETLPYISIYDDEAQARTAARAMTGGVE
jgi:hypothetical protein